MLFSDVINTVIRCFKVQNNLVLPPLMDPTLNPFTTDAAIDRMKKREKIILFML